MPFFPCRTPAAYYRVMEFGMFHEFQALPGATPAQTFIDSFAQIDAAEAWGLDAMWLAELHFDPARSVASSPLILAAAIAQRTHRMKIGTAVQVLPLCHPLRLAEEVATVDQLSGGRLIFGVGRSGFAHTYKTYGVDYSESRERFNETLEIVKRAFTGERFSHKGKHFAYDSVKLSPTPVQRGPGELPGPEIRVAAASPDTYLEVADLGHPIFVAARTGNLSELAPLVKTYRERWRSAGHPGKGQVFLRVPVYLAATDAAAREEPRESIMHLLRYIGDRLAASAVTTGAREIEKRAERGQKMQSIDYEEVLRERMIVGTPARVIDRLAQLEEELGLDGILAELNPGSLIPHGRVMTALQLLCEEVMPRFSDR
jgi:alkanesulfonate monooxygenase SsuD/methylene tetrahydromethanopterin reductase-like flavin-dependent oxidoreductase (luciferase family)